MQYSQNPKVMELYKKANDLFSQNKFEEAIELFGEVIEEDSNYTSAYFNRALAYAILGKYQEAAKDAEKVLELEPNSCDAPYVMGIISEYQNNFKDATEWYEKSLAKNPSYEAAKNRLAKIPEKIKYFEMLKGADAAIKKDPNNAEYYYIKGNMLSNLGKSEESVKEYDIAIRLNPNDARYHTNKGHSLVTLSKYEDAIKEYDIAIKLNPKNVYLIVSSRDSALKKLSKKSTVNISDVNLQTSSSQTEKITNQTINVERSKEARILVSDGIENYNKGDYVKAFDTFSEALQMEKRSYIVYGWLAATADKLQKHDDSRKYAELGTKLADETLEANPNNKDALMYKSAFKTYINQTPDRIQQGEAIAPTTEIPKEDFSDVAGMDRLKQRLKQLIIYPFKNPELAKKYNIKAGGGILLYGPPGCGKTFIAKAVAGEAKVKFIQAKISDLRSMWSGETSKNIHAIFDFARKNAPCILFFDEVDALGSSRDTAPTAPWYREATNTFLVEMDGATTSNVGILILGATNAPWIMDPALKRSGRFGSLVYVPPPDRDARKALFELYLKQRPLESSIDYEKLADLTNNFSAADIADICTEASKIPWTEAMSTGKERGINSEDLENTISSKKPTISTWYSNARLYIEDDESYSDLKSALEEYEGEDDFTNESYR